MMKFLVGVLAAMLWTGTLVGLFIIFRSSPKHPFQSIKEFRLARRRLAHPSAPLVEVVNEAALVEAPVFIERKRRRPEPEPPPLEEFEPAFQENLEPEEPLDVEGLWDYDEAAPEHEDQDEEIDEEDWDEDEEEDSETYDQDEYDEDEEESEEEELPDEEEEEGTSSLDIVLVDDFGKPAK